MVKRIAVLIPAHNEEQVIAETLRHAVSEADEENVYLVSDNCTDSTVQEAKYYLEDKNIFEVERMGRGPALMKALEHFGILDRYHGVLFLDADSLILAGTMGAYRRALRRRVAGVIGHMRVLSTQDNIFASWRRFQYFWGFNFNVRAADFYGGCFTVTPGCCTVYSTVALMDIDYDHKNPAEDMDFCFQIHRRKLGKIVWEPDAWVETTDPLSLNDYTRQLVRWGKGWWYNIIKHRVGLRLRPVDFLAGYFMVMMFFNWIRTILLVLLGLLYIFSNQYTFVLNIVALSFFFDIIVIGIVGLLSGFRRRLSLIRHIPLFPIMMVLDLCIYGYAFATHRTNLSSIWSSPMRVRGG